MRAQASLPHRSRARTAAAMLAALTVLSLPPQVRHAAAAALPAGSGSAANGRRLFMSYLCYSCHGTDGQGGAGLRLKPPALPPFDAFRSYVRKPAGRMPSYRSRVLSDAQLAAIYAYLKSIPAPAPAKSIPLLNQ